MARRTKSQELLEFEIAFYEKLVTAYPDFVDALIPLGHAYTRAGRSEQGLTIDLKLTLLRPQDPLMWYNLACSYSLLTRVDHAFGALRRAFELGYRDLEYLRSDPDLANVRRSPDYLRFLESVVAPRAGTAPAA